MEVLDDLSLVGWLLMWIGSGDAWGGGGGGDEVRSFVK